jgi:hypothetical protein
MRARHLHVAGYLVFDTAPCKGAWERCGQGNDARVEV